MRLSYIIAIILFIASLVIPALHVEAINGLELLTFCVSLMSAFVGLVNSGSETDGWKKL